MSATSLHHASLLWRFLCCMGILISACAPEVPVMQPVNVGRPVYQVLDADYAKTLAALLLTAESAPRPAQQPNTVQSALETSASARIRLETRLIAEFKDRLGLPELTDNASESQVLDLPWDFTISGASHRRLIAWRNGYLAFANSEIALFKTELTGGVLHAGVIGTAPNRTYTVLYTDMQIKGAVASSKMTGLITLHEKSNAIGLICIVCPAGIDASSGVFSMGESPALFGSLQNALLGDGRPHVRVWLSYDGDSADTDGDGVTDAEDSDDDNDGFSDEFEVFADTDPQSSNSDENNDGVPDDSFLASDVDGDGFTVFEETLAGSSDDNSNSKPGDTNSGGGGGGGNDGGSDSEQPPTSSFVVSGTFDVGAAPRALAIADLDGDGENDIVVVNFGDDNVSILLGSGDGNLGSSSEFAVGDGPNAVAIGDFDADGNQDLAVANGAGNSVSILLGVGDGTFVAGTTASIGSIMLPSSAIIAGNWDSDDNLDLMVLSASNSEYSVLLGDGAGNFAVATTNLTGGNDPFGMTEGFFNSDDNVDFAIANTDVGNVLILLGEGDGAFSQALVAYDVGSLPQAIASADFDGDGLTDLAVANFGDDSLSILFGNGDGTFDAAIDYDTGSQPIDVKTGDFDGDGDMDLVTADIQDDALSLFLNLGDGTFSVSEIVDLGVPPRSIAIDELDGDDLPDIAVINTDATDVSILLNSFSP